MHARENLRGKDLISYLLAHMKTNWTSCRNVISALFLRSSGTESPPTPRSFSVPTVRRYIPPPDAGDP